MLEVLASLAAVVGPIAAVVLPSVWATRGGRYLTNDERQALEARRS